MTRVEIKESAKENLRGRWGNAALYILLYGLIEFAGSWILIFVPFFGPIASMILSVVMSYNLVVGLVNFKRGEELNALDIVKKIPDNFSAAWKCVGGVLLKLLPFVIIIVILYSVLIGAGIATAFSAYTNTSFTSRVNSAYLGFNIGLIIFGIIAIFVVEILAAIKAYYYVLTQYVMIDSNNTLTGKQAAEKSRELMKGNRGKFFILNLSFIGWAILCVLIPFVGYIGLLWLIPYIQIATIIFYESLAGVCKEKKQEEVTVVTETTVSETPVATVVEQTETVVTEPVKEEPKVEETKPENDDPIKTNE